MGGACDNINGGGRNQKQRFRFVGVFYILLITVVGTDAAGGLGGPGEQNGKTSSTQRDVESLCLSDPDKCNKKLGSLFNGTINIKDSIKNALIADAVELQKHIDNPVLYKELVKDKRSEEAMRICDEVMDNAVDAVNKSVGELDTFDFNRLSDFVFDLQVWMAATLSDQQTCLDAFEKVDTKASQRMAQILSNSMNLSNNAIDMINSVSELLDDFGHVPSDLDRRPLSDESEKLVGGFSHR
ncbi:unnamed protein product [Lathyrus oleraceus]|uniref:Pectinesterase inhibitor domain-containing protein n=1 Tax=Pisum sativum TaxID=3888 RepID=A0A9D5BMT6_PEA|nr:probable pectinesterase/pectinesterase inhibitor 58 [Pisum sativum]KAI5446435.1 hypothetical protein KIW84_014317 [Pisum sativum]